MFIGREKELDILNKKMSSSNFEFGVIFGRRRIGKTRLLQEVVKKHKAIYYVANEMGLEENLKSLSKIVATFYNESFIFENFESLFEYLVKKSHNEKVIVIIDEFSYLMETNPEVQSILQNIIDQSLISSSMKLVLSGSQVGMIEDALSYKKPLYGRSTFKMKVEPFDYYDASMFYPNFSFEDKVRAYSVFGGIPFYTSRINDRLSLKQNIIELIVEEGAIFEDEITFFLSQEVRSVGTYGKILQAIASGATRLNEITTKSGSSNSGTVSKHIDTLMTLGIVDKEYSFGEYQKTKKTIYKIKDQLFDFHYTFIEKNNTQKVIMDADRFYNKMIEPHLDEYVSFKFEDVCMQFLIRKEKDTIEEISRYWYNDAKLKKDIEIDIALRNDEGIRVYECKWTNKKIDRKVVADLIKKGEHLGNVKVGFFSKSGFEDGLNEEVLYEVSDLYK